MRKRPKQIELELQEELNKDKNQLPEVRLRDREIQELYKLFRSFGINIPMRSLKFLHRKSEDPYSVDMRLFMRNTGYSCCDSTIDAIWDAYIRWTGTRMSLEDFLKLEEEERRMLESTAGEKDDDNNK